MIGLCYKIYLKLVRRKRQTERNGKIERERYGFTKKEREGERKRKERKKETCSIHFRDKPFSSICIKEKKKRDGMSNGNHISRLMDICAPPN